MKASDGSEGERFSTASVTVNVVRDRSLPALQGQDMKTISETTPVNASVLTVHASDSDLVVCSLSLTQHLHVQRAFVIYSVYREYGSDRNHGASLKTRVIR